MLALISVVVGAALLVAVWSSVLRTVFIPRESSSVVARCSIRVVAAASVWLSRRLPRRAGDRVMDYCAPLGLFVMASWWLLVLVAGFLLLAVGSGGIGLDATELTRVLTLRMTGPVNYLALVVWLSVPLVLASFTTHLIRFTDAYSRRERLIGGLATLATEPPDAERLLADHLRGGSRDNLDALFKCWAEWVADVHATHIGYPALVYYRSARGLSWFNGAVIMLDVAALVRAVAPEWAPPHTRMLLEAGSGCLRDLAERIGIQLPSVMNTVSLQGREECSFGDTVRLAVDAGLPEECNLISAWTAFQAERTRYAPYAELIGARLLYDRGDADLESDEELHEHDLPETSNNFG